jgi:hypothetical protein
MNYDEKQLTGKKIFDLFYQHGFCKYMSYGFPIINVYNPGVHYETPCMKVIFQCSAVLPKHTCGLNTIKNFCGLCVLMGRPKYTGDAQMHSLFLYFCVKLTKTETALEFFFS